MFSERSNWPRFTFSGRVKLELWRNEKPPCPVVSGRAASVAVTAKSSPTGSRERAAHQLHGASEVAHEREPVKVPMAASHRAHDFLHSARVVVGNSLR
jgi:hypothetical protein